MSSTEPNINGILSQSIIRYSQVWEDSTTLCTGLGINTDDHVLSIGSAGCNAFAMLLAGAQSVVAVDLNPAQIALIHLKKQAVIHCSLLEYRSLLGVSNDRSPLPIYQRIRAERPAEIQDFWDNNQALLTQGVIHVGKLDRYFLMFQSVESHLGP